jgi:hypothetical protein
MFNARPQSARAMGSPRFILLVCLLALTGCVQFSGKANNAEVMRKNIMSSIPAGTRREVAEQWLRSSGIGFDYHSSIVDSAGKYVDYMGGMVWYDETTLRDPKVGGFIKFLVKATDVSPLGNHWNLQGYLVFDKDDQLLFYIMNILGDD